MTWKDVGAITISAFALTLGSPGESRANLVLNGSFESYTPGANGAGDLIYSPLANWSSVAEDAASTKTGNLLFTAGSADTTGVFYDDTPYGGGSTYFGLWGPHSGVPNGLPATSPDGGNFVGLDADPLYNGALSQTINGLSAGHTYKLGFWWAGAQLYTTTGATTAQLQVSLGSQTQSTVVLHDPSRGFSGWMYQTMTFNANSSSDTLSFLALGTPAGLPPFVLLDGVSLVPASVAEPTSVALLVVGLCGVGLARRLRRPAGSVSA